MKTIYLILFALCIFANVNAQKLISRTLIAKRHFIEFTLATKKNDTVIFYLSALPKQTKLPLLVFVQGSGRHSLFTKDTVLNYGLRTLYDAARGKVQMLIVEKPGVGFLDDDKNPDDPSDNLKFNKSFSLQSWSTSIETAARYVVTREYKDKKIFIMGHSEGGLVAAKVAYDLNPLITHVAILAGEGPSQLYSLYAFADSGELFKSDTNKTPAERTDSVVRTWNDILKYPTATDKFFFGYAYLKWSSFLSTSVLEELQGFDGKIFIAQGTADKNVNPESAVFLYTGLLEKGKQVELHLIENADHSFYSVKAPQGWSAILNRSISWFLN